MREHTHRVRVTRENGRWLADEIVATGAARTGQAAVKLVAKGLSVRDAAALLGISAQRVSQLNAKAS